MSHIETNKHFSVIDQSNILDLPPLHLPPPDAFKEPEKWLRRIPYEEKIYLPVDDRGFLKTDEAIRLLLDEFDPAYQWRPVPGLSESQPDKHHKYSYRKDFLHLSLRLQEMGVEDWKMPMRFRENPSNIMLLPGLFHNFLHHSARKVGKPEYDADPQRLVKLEMEDMDEYLINYTLAHRALSTASSSAKNILRIEALATVRNEDVTRRFGTEASDPIGEKFIDQSLERYFRGYKMGIQAILSGVRLDLLMPPNEEVTIDIEPTYEQIIKIGEKSVRGAVNYLSYFNRSAA